MPVRGPEASFISFTINPPLRSGLSVLSPDLFKMLLGLCTKVEDTFIASRSDIIRPLLEVKFKCQCRFMYSRRCAGYFLPFIERPSVLLKKVTNLDKKCIFFHPNKKRSVKTSGTSQYTNDVLL